MRDTFLRDFLSKEIDLPFSVPEIGPTFNISDGLKAGESDRFRTRRNGTETKTRVTGAQRSTPRLGHGGASDRKQRSLRKIKRGLAHGTKAES